MDRQAHRTKESLPSPLPQHQGLAGWRENLGPGPGPRSMLNGLCKLPGNRGREQSLAVQPLPRWLFWTLGKHLGSAVGSHGEQRGGEEPRQW